ncbi:MAG: biotin--[acetyl-CoA-carboxylase] ligase, partial [Verrucomicrobiales bacterium]|nr:biotin--[acetyl-CoA-carboxylase] ligase [Verrucomicrobiales bacterium]
MTIDARILTALREAGHGSVSGSELVRALGISRAAIWARIRAFRELGYEIEASPHEGYRLRHSPDVLLADDLLSRLGKTQVIGRDIRVFHETTSTSDVVEKLARDGVKEGAVVFAESQTNGRGRLGRKWVSPSKKGLWFSILLRPDMLPQKATQITIAAATALARAIGELTELTARIKWPNDILISGKKVAGSLTELSAELDHVKYIVLGIGLNVNLTLSDFPADLRKVATSLRIETGHTVHRAELATAVLRELDGDYARVCSGNFEAVADEWERLCSTLGHNIGIRLGDRLLQGHAEALDSDGALLL